VVRDRFVFTEGFHLVSCDSNNCFEKFFDALLQKIQNLALSCVSCFCV
jgi:hypothetical protein